MKRECQEVVRWERSYLLQVVLAIEEGTEDPEIKTV